MNFGNIAGLMQKASKLQKNLQELEKNLASEVFKGEAGGGLVKVNINGNLNIISVDFDDSLLKPEEKGMLADLIAAAFNNAKTKAETIKKEKMQELTGGLPLPPGLGF